MAETPRTFGTLGALVPGQPHLLRGDLNPAWASLARSVTGIGDMLAAKGVQRVVYFSTKWLSVLGQMFQGRVELRGSHVDEMWYDLVDLPFDFRIDATFAEVLATAARRDGHKTMVVDYEGFPVDTGTIVVDRLLNRDRFQVNMVACSLYLDFAGMRRFGATVRQAIASDPVPTAVIGVSGLSGCWHKDFVAPEADRYLADQGDALNRQALGLMETGSFADLADFVQDCGGKTHLDMGGMALAFLMGAGVFVEGVPAHIAQYGSVYGTGVATVIGGSLG